MFAVEREQLIAELGRAELVEQAMADVDERHPESELAERGGDLHADETAADDDRPRGGPRRLADRVRVLERAQRVDAVELGAGHVQAPWRRARG